MHQLHSAGGSIKTSSRIHDRPFVVVEEIKPGNMPPTRHFPEVNRSVVQARNDKAAVRAELHLLGRTVFLKNAQLAPAWDFPEFNSVIRIYRYEHMPVGTERSRLYEACWKP